METRDYYGILIGKLRSKFSRNGNLARVLTELLSISKESVYRRLRGDVPFSFNELCILVKHFNISLDDILMQRMNDEWKYAQLSENASVEELFGTMACWYDQATHSISRHEDGEYNFASNSVPIVMLANYPVLYKFRIIKQMMLNSNSNFLKKFSEFDIPASFTDSLNRFSHQVMHLTNVNVIWDRNIFKSLVTEIRYFYQLHIIDEDDVRSLYDQLNEFVDSVEALAAQGESFYGKPLSVYISYMNIEANFIYRTDPADREFMLLYNTPCSMNLTHDQPHEINRNWLHSLKRHSVLITHSGQSERIGFFSEQRKVIRSLIERDPAVITG